jgi:hypothetical protein
MTTRKLARLLDRACLVRHSRYKVTGMVSSGIIRDAYTKDGTLYCTVEMDTMTDDGRLGRAEHEILGSEIWLAVPDTTRNITALEALSCSE